MKTLDDKQMEVIKEFFATKSDDGCCLEIEIHSAIIDINLWQSNNYLAELHISNNRDVDGDYISKNFESHQYLIITNK